MTDSKVQEKAKVTKKDLRRLFWRTMLGLQMGWNYETMQGLGYCFSIIPILKKLYKTKDEMKKALKLHLQFFNTTPAMTHLIIGSDVAMEEESGISNVDTITAIKTGLMGPFAGIGDTVFVAIYRTIIFSIASYMALQGTSLGILLAVIAAIAIWWVRYEFTIVGYDQGKKIALSFASQVKQLTEGAAILGLTVIGALAPSVVKANVPLVFQTGKVTLKVQAMLDNIMPALVPVAIIMLSYWLLGRKKMNATRLILVLLVLGVVLYNLKILG